MTFIYLMQGSIKKLIADKKSLKSLRNGIYKKRVEILKLKNIFFCLNKIVQRKIKKELVITGTI